MIRRLFLNHPRAVGESYGQHFGAAANVGLTMIGGGLAALVHAAVPAWFETRGSDTIRALYVRLNRRRPAPPPGTGSYEI